MERETTTQDDDQNPSTKVEQPPRKQLGSSVPGGSGGGGGGGGDRLKRDEWSEGAVMTLLEAYESKWILRNRAKLKGQDWEDVAKCVSSRSSNTKSPKTQTQCKNKIESMKKRYRSECASADTSSWPLFSRLHRLLRGSGAVVSSHASLPAQPVELSPVALTCLPPQPPSVELADNSHESNDVEPMVKENEEIAEKTSDRKNNNDEQHEHHEPDSSSSTPALYSNDQKGNISLRSRKRKRRRRVDSSGSGSWEDVAESIRCVANAVVRSEQARMDTMKEVERMRVEAEVKRGEMELKRTQIIADTQLEIARLFASALGKNVDDSLKIGKS